jgi:hypothetical protein
MRETRTSGSEGGGAKPIASPYPYPGGNIRQLPLDPRFRGGDNSDCSTLESDDRTAPRHRRQYHHRQ